MPRLVSLFGTVPTTGQIQSCTIYASPVGSTITFTHEFTQSLRIVIDQKIDANREYWKPNEVVIEGVESVRALRNACNKFLDRFHDEVES